MSPEAMAVSEMVGPKVKKREVMDQEQMKAVAIFVGWVKNGDPPHGSISIVAKNSVWHA